MKDELRRLLDKCLEHASEEDMNAIQYLLQGVQNKIEFNDKVYIGRLLHMDMNWTKDSCEITVPLNPVINNNLNIVHGGITATLLDTTMGSLANKMAPDGFGAVTSQLNIHYIAPGIGESLRCRAEIIHKGSKTLVVSGEVLRDDNKKVAHATGTFFIIPK